MEKLYSLVQTDDSRKADLYIRGQSSHSALKSALHKDEILDFCTYFNSISIKKMASVYDYTAGYAGIEC